MSEVEQFYRGKTLLITGATGFMGKVLVEKLLRSCPGVSKLFVLLRPKGKSNVAERRTALVEAQIFNFLKTTSPSQLDKLEAVAGDIMQPGLGLSTKDRVRLQQEVNIIFHSAATVKFDEELKVSINMNVRGTQALLNLAKQMKQLEALVHVSTAYCNCDRPVIEERVYDMSVDPRKVMAAVDWLDDQLIAQMTPRLLGDRPNTYTFTKAMAESVIVHEKEDLPVAIVRPSIVTCAWQEPLAGWVDNFNGPTGLVAGASKGLINTMVCNGDLVADIVPVDIPINLMISAAWHVAKHRPAELPVFNCTSGSVNPLRWEEIRARCLQEVREHPAHGVFWYPDCVFTKSPAINAIRLATTHMVPSYLFDMVLYVCGRRPVMSRTYWKMKKAMACLEYFTTHEWEFRCDNVLALRDRMSPADLLNFDFSVQNIKWNKYLAAYCSGVKKFVFKEVDNVDKARTHINRMYYLSAVTRFLLYLFSWTLIARRFVSLRAPWSSMAHLLQYLLRTLSLARNR